jgi:hypothetical protein
MTSLILWSQLVWSSPLVVEDFEDLDQTLENWGLQCEPGSSPSSVALVARGACALANEDGNHVASFGWEPWQFRVPADASLRRGGAEIWENNSATNNPNGWWDNAWGSDYPTAQRTLRYSWRFRLDDISALQHPHRFAEAAWVGQWHHRNDPSGSLGCNGPDTRVRHPTDALGRSPVLGILLTVDGDEAVLRLKAKQPIAAYYRIPGNNPSLAGGNCRDGFCSVTLAEHRVPLDSLDTWHTTSFTIDWQMLREDFDYTIADQTPSAGSVQWWVDGQPMVGDSAHKLDWVANQTTFRGLTTMVNECTNFMKLGLYVNNFNLDPYNLYPNPLELDATGLWYPVQKQAMQGVNVRGRSQVVDYPTHDRGIRVSYDDITVSQEPTRVEELPHR